MDQPIIAYTIDGFSGRYATSPGGRGFSIELHQTFVGPILKARRNPEVPLNRMIEETLLGSVELYDKGHARVRYLEDTWFLLGIQIGGQCACLSIDGGDCDMLTRFDENVAAGMRSIMWNPHNIDTPRQAAAALATWLVWFNHVSLIGRE